MAGAAVSMYGGTSMVVVRRRVMTTILLCVCVSVMLLERTIWYTCSNSPVVLSKEAVGHLFCVPWILCSTVPTANKAQGSGTLVQAVNVYGIFGAFVIVLSNERDCPCIRRVALNAATENLQMAGK
jgi:hypothetical protein